MKSQGDFEVRDVEGVMVVDVTGDVDITNAVQFESMLRDAARADRRVVVVSLAGVHYLDSKGIHVLFDFLEHLTTTRQRLLLVAPDNASARRLLEFAGLTQLVPVFDSVGTAVTAGREG